MKMMQQQNEFESQLLSNALEMKKLKDKIHEIEKKERKKYSNISYI